jgi:hypothetical protein
MAKRHLFAFLPLWWIKTPILLRRTAHRIMTGTDCKKPFIKFGKKSAENRMSLVDDRITRAFSGVTNGRLSSMVAKMDEGNTIQIAFYPHAENVKCLENGYNQQDGCPTVDRNILSSNTEFQRVAQELDKEHGYKIVDAIKPSDETKIQMTLEKR